MKKYSVYVFALVLLAGCARNLEGDVYSSGEVGGKVLRGYVVSARPVIVKDTDDTSSGSLGGIAGGVAGGVAGAGVGGGTGRNMATVGGVIAGAVLGSIIEDQLSTQQGVEYIVQLNPDHRNANPNRWQEERRIPRNDAEEEVRQSIEFESQTDVLSVVQADEEIIPEGSAVFIVYHGDRPRVVRDRSR